MGPLALRVESDRKVDSTFLVSLMRSALERERRMLIQGIERTKQELARYERKYGMTSEQFYERFSAGDGLEDSEDFISWAGEYEILELLREKQRQLEGVHVHAG